MDIRRRSGHRHRETPVKTSLSRIGKGKPSRRTVTRADALTPNSLPVTTFPAPPRRRSVWTVHRLAGTCGVVVAGDFFTLGGDSPRAMRLTAKVRDAEGRTAGADRVRAEYAHPAGTDAVPLGLGLSGAGTTAHGRDCAAPRGATTSVVPQSPRAGRLRSRDPALAALDRPARPGRARSRTRRRGDQECDAAHGVSDGGREERSGHPRLVAYIVGTG